MADNKLFRVNVQYTYFAYAENAAEAESFAMDAADYANTHACAVPVRHSDEHIPMGWSRESEVYNDDKRTYFVADEPPMTLGALLDQLPKRGDQ